MKKFIQRQTWSIKFPSNASFKGVLPLLILPLKGPQTKNIYRKIRGVAFEQNRLVFVFVNKAVLAKNLFLRRSLAQMFQHF